MTRHTADQRCAVRISGTRTLEEYVTVTKSTKGDESEDEYLKNWSRSAEPKEEPG
jgi:hypothetical protein